MKRCRECIHIEVCLNHHGFMSVSGMESWIGQDCSFFEDKTRFVKLSYKIGDMFYEPKRHQITEYQITRIVLNEFGLHFEVILKKGVLFRSIITSDDIGKIVFVTREEAEHVLKEREIND